MCDGGFTGACMCDCEILQVSASLDRLAAMYVCIGVYVCVGSIAVPGDFLIG